MIDMQPELVGENFVLRPLSPLDFDELFHVGKDPSIWSGHHAPDRYREQAFLIYFKGQLTSGAALAFVDRATGKVIGCSRYYPVPDQPGAIAIGSTFLGKAYWGGVADFEIKSIMLEHAFSTVDEVWFHIDAVNIRSQKATSKLGAIHAYDAYLEISGRASNWMCFQLTKRKWAQVRRARLQHS